MRFHKGHTDEHKGWRELASSYLDGQLSNREQAALELHIAGCQRCRAEVEQLRSVVTVLRRTPQMQVPRSFTLPATPVATPASSWFLRGAGPLRYVAAATAMLFVAVVAGDIVLQGQGAPGYEVPTSAQTEDSLFRQSGDAGSAEADLPVSGTPEAMTAPPQTDSTIPQVGIAAAEKSADAEVQPRPGPETLAAPAPGDAPEVGADRPWFLWAEAVLGATAVILGVLLLLQRRLRRSLRLDA